MAAWSEFVDKDSSEKYIEKLNWITENQVTELASLWYDAGRYFLARQKLAELKHLLIKVQQEIKVLEDDLAEIQRVRENASTSRLDSDFIRTSKNQIRLLQHVESEINSTISYLSTIPSFSVPGWFVDFLKTVVSSSDSIEINPTDRWTPDLNQSKEPSKRKRKVRQG